MTKNRARSNPTRLTPDYRRKVAQFHPAATAGLKVNLSGATA